MAKFMLLIRGGYEKEARLSPEDIQQIIGKYRDWSRALSAAGQLSDAGKLCDDGGGRRLQNDGRGIVVDGPFTETKETVGGYFIVEAADYAEAVELARGCPGLAPGDDVTVEVRRIEM